MHTGKYHLFVLVFVPDQWKPTAYFPEVFQNSIIYKQRLLHIVDFIVYTKKILVLQLFVKIASFDKRIMLGMDVKNGGIQKFKYY